MGFKQCFYWAQITNMSINHPNNKLAGYQGPLPSFQKFLASCP